MLIDVFTRIAGFLSFSVTFMLSVNDLFMNPVGIISYVVGVDLRCTTVLICRILSFVDLGDYCITSWVRFIVIVVFIIGSSRC